MSPLPEGVEERLHGSRSPASEFFLPTVELDPEPGESLLAPLGTLLEIETARVLAESASGERRRVGCFMRMPRLEVRGEARVGGKRGSPQPGRLHVELFQMAEPGEPDKLVGFPRSVPPEHSGKLLVQLDETLGVLDPFCASGVCHRVVFCEL